MKENLEAERKQKQKWDVAVNSKSAQITMICGFGRNRKSEEARSFVVVLSSLSPAVLLVATSAGLDNGVGVLLVMGWSTWNLFGCWGADWTEHDV